MPLSFSVSKVLSGWSHLQGALTVLATAPLGQQTAKQRSFSRRRLFSVLRKEKKRKKKGISRDVLPTPKLGWAITTVSTA